MIKCYLCDKPFDGKIVVDHKEHIIQNSIGGGITAESILCKSCGAGLGETVDKPFFNAIRALAVVFDLRRERGGKASALGRVIPKEGFEVIPNDAKFWCRHNEVKVPNQPVIIINRIKKEIYIFAASLKQKKQFIQSSSVQEYISNKFTISDGIALEELIEGISFDININSTELLRGLIKIAISYALYNGIDRKYIQNFIIDDKDIICDDELIKNNVISYFPTGIAESLYEAYRYKTDDFPPNHQLILFSIDCRLYCYIDLFGIVQKYVQLTDEYVGDPIIRRYVQKCPKWIFKPTDWQSRRYKDLLINAQQFGVDTYGRTREDIQRDVLNKAESRSYELPADDHLDKIEPLLSRLVQLPHKYWRGHSTISDIYDRALRAEREFGCEYLSVLGTNKLLVMRFIQNFDKNHFRIKNEKGTCPFLSSKIDSVLLKRYQKLRVSDFLTTFGNSGNMSINILQ